MDNIQITEDLDIDYEDLGKKVDFSVPFTLRNVINAVCFSSHIPVEIMERMLACPYLFDYLQEAQKPDKKDEWLENMEYLEVYWEIEKMTTRGKTSCDSMWSFHGVSKKGYVGEDVKEMLFPDGKVDPEYRSAFAVEFSPVSELADFEIKMRNEFFIQDWDNKDYKEGHKIMPYTPDISLFELLYAIFWELSFVGSPEDRDEKIADIKSRKDEYDEAKANGTLDSICVPWEDVKARMKERLGFEVDEVKVEDKEKK